jgi:hypothetical protein
LDRDVHHRLVAFAELVLLILGVAVLLGATLALALGAFGEALQ